MKLFLCVTCNRHIKGLSACPFCGDTEQRALVGDSAMVARRVNRTALALAGGSVGAALALALAGCSSSALYGCSAPPPECPVGQDAEIKYDAGGDADAFDAMPDTTPDALETGADSTTLDASDSSD